jgi:O-methyltransferase
MISRKDLNIENKLITNSKLKFGDSLVNNQKTQFIRDKIIELNNIDSSVVEVGVYKGGTAKIILETMNKDSNLFLFDTFEGIPNECEFDNICNIGDFNDSPYDDIINYFNKFKNVYIFKGIFPQETSMFIKNKKFKFVHLDVDTYQSYKESLEFFYDKMIAGGYIVFDDYNEPTCAGATKAVNEFFNNKIENIQKNNKSYFIIKQ